MGNWRVGSIGRIVLTLVLLGILLSSLSFGTAAATTAVVTGTNGDGLRLRQQPSLDAMTLTVMPEGATVTVTGSPVTDSDGHQWLPVRYNGLDGFAMSTFLKPAGDSTAQLQGQAFQVGQAVVVTHTDGDGVNIRQGPSYQMPVITAVPEGTVLKIAGEAQTDTDGNTWWPVQYSGVKGWVNGQYLAPTNQPSAASALPSASGVTFRVYAHREGLIGSTTANGHTIQPTDIFVALPCACALASNGGGEFKVLITYNGRAIVAPVWDVGPWNVDDNYWDPPTVRRWKDLPQGVPEAMAAYYQGYNNGQDGSGRKVASPAGIDISDAAFYALGMTDSDWVTVTFLWVGQPADLNPSLPAGYDAPTVQPGQRPPLDPTPPKDARYYTFYAQTGHNVPAFFQAFWSAHGGLEAFGLPMSEVFREARIDGTTRIVQYFERAIFVYNPSAPADQRVQLAPIGYYATAPDQAWLPVAPFASNADHEYNSQTGHSLNFGLKQYWHDHDGMTTLGPPITEEFRVTLPDGRWYIAQLFVYGRLEWWPDRAGQPDAITRGRLTVELLQQAGWLNPSGS
ncbi:SH3 domain-containing protein [Thermorudis peleae]|uniref:SH3 domain-containing protein n=1 Tax=Thermorudis peleae TaxID=1382356 RepID=UPI000689C164|nr:SH3 domain-containing protein [Thermorudis peleae]